MLFLLNEDRPGMIGHIGTALGASRVNIANMNVSRNREGGRALTAIQVDEPLPEDAARRLAEIDGATRVRVVRLLG